MTYNKNNCMSASTSTPTQSYDTKFLVHVGLEILIVAGIGFYFHRKTMQLSHENDMMKNQLRELSEKIANSNNPLLKRDDLHNQVKIMESTIIELNAHIENIKRQLTKEYQALKVNDDNIATISQQTERILANETSSITDKTSLSENSKTQSINDDVQPPKDDPDKIANELKALDNDVPETLTKSSSIST